jgi:gliding motility-associated-like protein
LLPAYIDIHSPQTPSIWAATVEGDNQVAVIFHEELSLLFNRYLLWGESGLGIPYYISTNTLRTDTVLFDNASNSVANSVCYRPMVIDTCGDSTNLSLTRLHCTVELMAISANDQVLLNWSPYVGWTNVLRYDIFEVNDYDTTAVNFLASVAGNATSWADTNLTCGQSRTYRVRAIGTVPQERSWSDTSAARPLHQPPTWVPEMVVATIVNNLEVNVAWNAAIFPGANSYQLYRSVDGINWNSLGILPTSTLQYLDPTVNVAAQSYYYQVTVADSCSAWSPPSNAARSILLQLDGSDGSVQLDWNAYTLWAGGVNRYELEARPLDGGAWTLMATLTSTTLDFHDNQGLPGAPGVCYRVLAYEAGGNQAVSMSNEVCFTMDVWVPNTLTPNGDGLNDVLIIRALAGYPGTGITIYNRWGNLVYQTSDYQNDWAGTNGNTGDPLPDGTYFWVLDVSDGRQMKGYVTILR